MIYLLIIARILIVLMSALLIKKNIKRPSKKELGIMALFLVIFALLAQVPLKSVSPLSETFKLTALGQHNDYAKAEEVFLHGITIDGKSVEISRPIEGKWFWSGINYAWRVETDTRQPEGTTRSVMLKLPVGQSRTLQFESNIWRGLVRIDYLRHSWVYDTYTDTDQITSFQLPESANWMLIANEALRLAIFSLVFGAFSLALYFALSKWKKSPDSVKVWAKRNDYRLACGLTSLASLLIMIKTAAVESLWNDEIYQIGYALQNVSIWKQLVITPAFYPSLFGRVLDAWYYIAPYGESYLLLPTMIFTAIGIYFIGLIGYTLRGLRTGVIAVTLAGFANTVIYHCGYEFRSYAFLFCMSAITLWLYIKQRSSGNQNFLNRLLFGLSMWLAASSHLFGLFFCIPFFIMDIMFFAKKRINLNHVVSYIFALIFYIPWVYNMISFKAFNFQATWQGSPSLGKVISLMNFLSGYNTNIFYLMLFGFCFAVITYFLQRTDKNNTKYFSFLLALTIVFVVCLLFVYGRYINQTATMWMDRYFVILFPCTFLLAAIGTDSLLQLIDGKQLISYSLCAAILIIITLGSYTSLVGRLQAGYEHFREAANWLYTQQNTIYNKDTLIVYGPDSPLTAWQDYYLTQKGRRDPLNVIDQRVLTPEDLIDKNVVYLYYEHSAIMPSVVSMLDEKFNQTANDGFIKMATFIRK